MSFIITIECPTHPTYAAKVAPNSLCKCCRLLFDVRNNTHKVLSVPREERTDTDERVIKDIA